MIASGNHKWIFLLLLGMGAGIFCFFYGDIYLSTLCAGLSHPMRNSLKVVSHMLSPPFHLAFWSAIYLTAMCRKKKDRFLSFSEQILYSLWISLPLVYCMKIMLGRARPELFVQNIYGFYFMMHNHHYHSFPSGHAAVASCLLMPLLRLLPKFRIVWMVLFLLLSSSRVLLNYHYASDIVGSATICYILQEFWRRKNKDTKKRKSDLYNPIS